jgi:MFS family permease
VADYFPARGRALAMGILSSGIALGGVLGLLLGGHLEARYGWRVAFMAVGVPGFVLAVLVSRLKDPSREPARLTVRSFLRDFEIGAMPLLRNLWPLLAGVAVGAAAAYQLDRQYGADSKADLAVFSAAVGLGLAFTIFRWVRRTPTDDDSVFGSGISGAFDDIARAGSFDRIADVAQCLRWLCSMERLTPRSASCTDDTCISTSAQ